MYKNNFICAIKHKGKILREVDGEVCLPFGSHYSVLLKNKDSRRALVDIEVDGENVLDGKSLIVDGNTSQEIKGFMRNMSVTNRFKFIHKTKEISDYRGNRIYDGLVSVSYIFEKEAIRPIKVAGWRSPVPYEYPYTPKYGSYNFNDNTLYTGITTNATTCCVNVPKITCCNLDDGITVKGAEISQQYQYGDIGELERKSDVITIQLKGITEHKRVVTRALTVKTKFRCPTCGRRSKSNTKFCPNCGTYLR